MELIERKEVLKLLYTLTQAFALLDLNSGEQSAYTEMLRLYLNLLEEFRYTTVRSIGNNWDYGEEWFEGKAVYTKDISEDREIWIDIMLENEEEECERAE